MLANAMRGLATEFGVTVPRGIGRLEELVALADVGNTLPGRARRVIRDDAGERHAWAGHRVRCDRSARHRQARGARGARGCRQHLAWEGTARDQRRCWRTPCVGWPPSSV